MDKIKYINDRRGRKRYPITHEKGVRDSDYVTLEMKLKELQDAVKNIPTAVGSVTIIAGTVSSNEFTPDSATFAEASAAFLTGPVILTYTDDGKDCSDMIVYADNDSMVSSKGVSWAAADEMTGDDDGEDEGGQQNGNAEEGDPVASQG